MNFSRILSSRLNLTIFSLVVLFTCVLSMPEVTRKDELNLSSQPDLTKDHQYKVQNQGHGRSVNLSFFVPAFSLFALASQYMPQLFPSFTATTQQRRTRRAAQDEEQQQQNAGDWLENFIQNGLIF